MPFLRNSFRNKNVWSLQLLWTLNHPLSYFSAEERWQDGAQRNLAVVNISYVQSAELVCLTYSKMLWGEAGPGHCSVLWAEEQAYGRKHVSEWYSRLLKYVNYVLYEDHEVNYANSHLQCFIISVVVYSTISKIGYGHFLSHQFAIRINHAVRSCITHTPEKPLLEEPNTLILKAHFNSLVYSHFKDNKFSIFMNSGCS